MRKFENSNGVVIRCATHRERLSTEYRSGCLTARGSPTELGSSGEVSPNADQASIGAPFDFKDLARRFAVGVSNVVQRHVAAPTDLRRALGEHHHELSARRNDDVRSENARTISRENDHLTGLNSHASHEVGELRACEIDQRRWVDVTWTHRRPLTRSAGRKPQHQREV
jgi:hypothetical protein